MAREVSSMAPWAETVPGAPYPMSQEEYDRWPREPGWRYELVEGRLVRVGEPGVEHGAIVARIIAVLMAFVLPRGLGMVYGPAAYRLPQPGETKPTELEPDVTCVGRGRGPVPGTPQHKHPGDFAPDLVVEVASEESNQYRPEMSAKAHKYLRGGVRLVWRPPAPHTLMSQLGLV